MNDDCTVVIQGPINKLLSKSIPKYLERYKVVLSSWEPENEEERNILNDARSYNIEITLEKSKEYQWFNRSNIYRQSRTTLNGLYKVKTKFAVKVRTDCYFSELSNLIDKIEEDRLTITDIYMNYEYPFHISDYILGSTRDSLLLTFTFLDILCRFTPPCLKQYFPDHRWFGLNFVPTSEALICSAYLRSKHIYPSLRDMVSQMNDNLILVPRDKLGKYIFTSNDRNETISNE